MARTPAPTALKLVKGERKDRVNDAEPIPALTDISPPPWLNEAALAVWEALAPDLERQKVLTAWDVEALARWCDAVVRHRHAARMMDELGEVVTEPVLAKGEVVGFAYKRNPWCLVWKQTDEVIARVGARFGLTPVERADLKVGRSHGDNDEAEDYFT